MKRKIAIIGCSVGILIGGASGADAHPVTSTGTVNGYPCGGTLPPCYVLARESGGHPTAQNPRSSASGLWQFVHGTWNHYYGYNEAKYAPPSIQNQKAADTWNYGKGCYHWNAC